MHTPILGTFFLASAQEIQEGANWYRNANYIAESIAIKTGLSIRKVAGVMAALSPRNRWERNCIDAEQLCLLYSVGGIDAAKQLKVSTFNGNKQKALDILQSEEDAIENILNGRKIVAFFRCILDEDDVCIDGHAYSIWLGNRVVTTKTPKISAKLYNEIAWDYDLATLTINKIMGTDYTAAQIQAITWNVHRNLYQGK
jgi:hypothetical protein